MNPRLRRNLAMATVAALVVAVAFAVVRRQSDEPGVRGLAAASDDPFASGDSIAGAFDGELSPNAARLAVLSEDGLGIVERNRIVPISEQGANVVDVAWFPNSATVLVAEGPTPTGLLAVVDVDDGGTVRGSIRLEPSIGFGEGFGMSVAPGGKRAVVTAVERPPFGAERQHLVAVDLETGAASDLTPPDGPDERQPVHLSDERVAFVEQEGERFRTKVVDLTTGAVEDGVDGSAVVGATDGTPVVVDPDGRLLAGSRQLGAVPPGATVVGVDVAGEQAVIVESTPSGARLRRISL